MELLTFVHKLENGIEACLKRIRSEFFDYRWEFATFFALCVVAYGYHAFSSNLVADDWIYAKHPTHQETLLISIGRWFLPVIRKIFYGNRFAPALSLAMACISFALISFLLVKLSREKERLSFLLFACLWGFSPIFGVVLAYKVLHLPIAIGLLFIGVSVFLGVKTIESKKRKIFPAALFVLFFVLTAAIRQSLAILLMVLLIGICFTRGIHKKESKLLNGVTQLAALLLFSSVSYLGSVYAILNLTGITPLEGWKYNLNNTIALSQIPHSIYLVLQHLKHFLFQDQHLWPAGVKYAFLVIVFFWVAYVVRAASRKYQSVYRGCLCTFLYMGIIFLLPFSIAFINPELGYRFTGLMALSGIYPLVFLQTMHLSQSKLVRLACCMLCIAIIFSFIFFQNVATTAVAFNNKRDLATMNQILSYIQSKDLYNRNTKVYFIGKLKSGKARLGPPFAHRTRGGVFRDSAINSSLIRDELWLIPRLADLMSFEFLGIKYLLLNPKILAKQIEMGGTSEVFREAYARAQPWPHSSSIFRIGERVYVVLRKHTS